MKKRTGFCLLMLFCFQLSSKAQISKYAGEFLSIGVGSRASAMGNAQVASANDITGAYWNPACLAEVNYPQASYMHEEHFGSLVGYDYGALALPYGPDMTFALSAIRLSIDGIPDTRDALYDANGDGKLDINTDRLDYSKIKEFSNSDMAFFLSFAKKRTDRFSWGITAKIIRRSIAEYSATGIGIDAAVLYRPTDRLRLGANLTDATTTLVAWSTGRNELISPTLRTGAAYSFDFLKGSINPALDMDIRFEDRKYASTFHAGPVSFDMKAGLEYAYKNLFSIRGGYNDLKQFCIGAGLKLPKLYIDYSFARFNASSQDRLPDSHRISLILSLEEDRFKRQSE